MNIVMMAQMQPWHGGGHFMGMHWLWWTFWVLTILLVGWALARLAMNRRGTDGEVGRETGAEEQLRQRFARGEIDEEEYERRLRMLRGTRPDG